MIRDESIHQYLTRLGSGEPTPGGGATGSVQLALGAGLLSMAARFSDREDLARHCLHVAEDALEVADQDESRFEATAEAFGLPQDTERQRQVRSDRIQQVLEGAVVPPQRMVAGCAELLGAAQAVLDDCNPNVLSDVGAAVGAVRAGLTAAVLTLETNLTALKDEPARRSAAQDLEAGDRLADRAEDLIRQVREQIGA